MVILREILKNKSPEYFSKFLHIENNVKNVASRVRTIFSTYTNHDINHLQNVESYVNEIVNEKSSKKLTADEIFCLLSAVWLHDIGMIPLDDDIKKFNNMSNNEREKFTQKIRDNHHLRSKLYVEKHERELNLNEDESEIIGNICKGHRKINLTNLKDGFLENKIRVNILASILRLADECDVSQSRESSLSVEGIDDDIKKKHYRIHELISTVNINHENKYIELRGKLLENNDEYIVNKTKEKIITELKEINPFLNKIDIYLDDVILNIKRSRDLLKKEIILNLSEKKDINSIVDDFTSKKDLEDKLESFIQDNILSEELNISRDIIKFKEIYKLFSEEDMKLFYFSEYVQSMVNKCFLTIENNFNVLCNEINSNLRLELIKRSPTAFHMLLFTDEIIENPKFNFSSNQNGILMLDSIILFGIFNDIYHYNTLSDIEFIEKNIRKLNIYNEEFLLSKINYCKELRRIENEQKNK